LSGPLDDIAVRQQMRIVSCFAWSCPWHTHPSHALSHTGTQLHTHTETNTCVSAYLSKHIYIHVYEHKNKAHNTCVHPQPNNCKHTRTHTYTHCRIHTHTHTHVHTHNHTHSLVLVPSVPRRRKKMVFVLATFLLLPCIASTREKFLLVVRDAWVCCIVNTPSLGWLLDCLFLCQETSVVYDCVSYQPSASIHPAMHSKIRHILPSQLVAARLTDDLSSCKVCSNICFLKSND
jgi:hypothetical protein